MGRPPRMIANAASAGEAAPVEIISIGGAKTMPLPRPTLDGYLDRK